ncbi:hypothetical protein AB9M75_03360 [Lactobacillus sp. AN1001]
MPQIIQFFHPGPEDRSKSKDGIVSWKSTYDGHARKFLCSEGKAIDGDNQIHENIEIAFWGEWEGDAEVIELGNGGCAKRLFKPFIDRKNLYEMQHNQNTDPLVFGRIWYYSNCKQERALRLKKLNLEKIEDGSIIVFGSVLNGNMVIDTVFVVKKSECYSEKIVKENIFLREVTLAKLMESNEVTTLVNKLNDSGLRLYFGKKYDEGEPYSFVPAKIIEKGNMEFARPSLDVGLFKKKFPQLDCWQEKPNGNHARWVYMNTVDEQQCKEIWNYIKDIVTDLGLVLGVDFKEPEVRN